MHTTIAWSVYGLERLSFKERFGGGNDAARVDGLHLGRGRMLAVAAHHPATRLEDGQSTQGAWGEGGVVERVDHEENEEALGQEEQYKRRQWSDRPKERLGENEQAKETAAALQLAGG